MTPQDVITTARYILNDTSSSSPRQSDDELLGYVNEGVKTVQTLRPELFSTVGDFLCQVGQCEQSLVFASATALIEVLSIHGGAAVTQFDLDAMNRFNPGWRTDAEGAAKQWARFSNDQLKFFIYPKAPADQTIDVRYVRTPAVFALADQITDLPLGLQPALVDFVVYRAESKDNEHVLSQRAAAALATFTAQVKG
jgi:hypothetical protein